MSVVAIVLIEVGGAARETGGPEYTVPSSPGAKANAEQNPSDEHMMSVVPSSDLAKVSWKVCRLGMSLLTMPDR